MPSDFLTKLFEIGSTAGIAMVGGLGHNLYLIRKGRKFTALIFVVNVLLAGFLGYLLGKLMPAGNMRDFMLGIAGFSSFPILTVFEEKGADLVLKKIGITIDDDELKEDKVI